MRKKKIIGIILAAALVAAGLGGYAYAQEEPDVRVDFWTSWNYEASGNVFTNGEVTGSNNEWATGIHTGATPVSELTLSLDSELEFGWVEQENLTQMGPTTYVWSFGDVAERSDVNRGVAFWDSGWFPVTFTPGFDASRSADITKFSEPGTQTLTITVTPRDAAEVFEINVDTREDKLVDAIITSPTTDEAKGITLAPDGHYLWIWPTGLEIDKTYTYEVTIEVKPKVPGIVEFMPAVPVQRHEYPNSGTTAANSVSYPAFAIDEVIGEWTCSAEGSYVWGWNEVIRRLVSFPEYQRAGPVAQASIDPYLAPVGSEFTFDGSGSYGKIVTWEWDFGDGSGDKGKMTTHAYTLPGVYKVVLTVTDDMGKTSTDSVLAVVHDPEVGFVTGGGWINSPEGAYTDDSLLTGKATFGFVSKYEKGANTPSGETEFRFRVADLNFHSTSYQWLVVAGAKAIYKGEGTINGEGLYKFMLTAIDADINDSDSFDIDRFRIKIWGPDGVVYDNALGDDSAEATTKIEGGSIVIHAKK